MLNADNGRQGYLAMVLHAHLPYVHHPEEERSLEEKWFFEAIIETYVPLLMVFQNLNRDGIPFRLTMSLTPPLVSMFANGILQKRFLDYLENLRILGEKEAKRVKGDSEFESIIEMYRKRLEETFYVFHDLYHDNLTEGFRYFQNQGCLELITCAVTHGYMPLLGLQQEALKTQVETAVKIHTDVFGRKPLGIWLPECGYYPDSDIILAQNGIKYFILDTHGLIYASPKPRYGIYAPIMCPKSGVAAFARDPESSKQVWSVNEGYPGDMDYREFYRDIGYDLDMDYIGPHLHLPALRSDTGLKYYRITSKGDYKLPYNPFWARDKAASHAGNFMFNREHQVRHLSSLMDRPPIIVAPYDAELFGHWWFEGPMWIEFLIRKVYYDQHHFSMITPGDYLERHPHNQPSEPSQSSWGNKGYNEVWLNGSNDWIYRHLHHAAQRLINITNSIFEPSPIVKRAMNQACRELLLAQSSDWAFIMKTGTMVEYATRRTVTHLGRMHRICDEVDNGYFDLKWLQEVEEKDNILPEMDYRHYQTI